MNQPAQQQAPKAQEATRPQQEQTQKVANALRRIFNLPTPAASCVN